MIKIDFTRDEVAMFKQKCYFTEEEEMILDYIQEKHKTIKYIAIMMTMNERTVNRRIQSIKKKIMRVL